MESRQLAYAKAYTAKVTDVHVQFVLSSYVL